MKFRFSFERPAKVETTFESIVTDLFNKHGAGSRENLKQLVLQELENRKANNPNLEVCLQTVLDVMSDIEARNRHLIDS